MTLQAITDRHEIGNAIDDLRRFLASHGHGRELSVKTRGGGMHGEFEQVVWNDALKFWSYIDIEGGGTRYWCCFGVVDPALRRWQAPILQVNPPVEGRNFHCKGALARDEGGHIHYLHSGGVGGGHHGVGQSGLLESRLPDLFGLKESEVVWPDRTQRAMLDLGRIGDDGLLIGLERYLTAVAKFKIGMGAQASELSKVYAKKGRIFLSHSRKDDDWCRRMMLHLRSLGIGDIWYSGDDMQVGRISQQIRTHIEGAPILVVVLSPDAVSSKYVDEEIDYALSLLEEEQEGRGILPVVAVPCRVPGKIADFLRVSGAGSTSLTPEDAAAQVVALLTPRVSTHREAAPIAQQGEPPRRRGFFGKFGGR